MVPSLLYLTGIISQLKGGDSVLYHAVKLYKLMPELHWAAGGYIWPIDRTVEVGSDTADSGALTFGGFAYSDPDESDSLRTRVENSGAVPLAEADISILSDWQVAGSVSKERVPFVSNGDLEKLVVNVLLVLYVA
jgi:hypothetical protein